MNTTESAITPDLNVTVAVPWNNGPNATPLRDLGAVLDVAEKRYGWAINSIQIREDDLMSFCACREVSGHPYAKKHSENPPPRATFQDAVAVLRNALGLGLITDPNMPEGFVYFIDEQYQTRAKLRIR